MNAMVPVNRNGHVIGYIWANELVSNLEAMLNRSTGVVSILLLITYLLMIVTVVVFIRQLMRTEKNRATPLRRPQGKSGAWMV
jgi:hypothetical protein